MRRLTSLTWVVGSLFIVAVFSGCGGGGGGGGGDSGPLRVGVFHSLTAPAVADTVAKLEASGEFESVTAVDCSIAIPSLVAMQGYDVILVAGDIYFDDATQMGDRLADAIDSGVGVVLAVFTTAFPNSITGRFATDNYFAILGDNSQQNGDGPVSWDDDAPGHPLLDGVVLFGGGLASFRPGVGAGIVGGSTLVASWLDAADTPLIVERVLPNGRRRVDLGFLPATTDGYVGGVAPGSDAMRMVVNALLRVGGQL